LIPPMGERKRIFPFKQKHDALSREKSSVSSPFQFRDPPPPSHFPSDVAPSLFFFFLARKLLFRKYTTSPSPQKKKSPWFPPFHTFKNSFRLPRSGFSSRSVIFVFPSSVFSPPPLFMVCLCEEGGFPPLTFVEVRPSSVAKEGALG